MFYACFQYVHIVVSNMYDFMGIKLKRWIVKMSYEAAFSQKLRGVGRVPSYYKRFFAVVTIAEALTFKNGWVVIDSPISAVRTAYVSL